MAEPLESTTDQNVIGTRTGCCAPCAPPTCARSCSAHRQPCYGTPLFLPYTRAAPAKAVNPYGRTKLVIEEMLRDQHVSDPTWGIAILRYFNPSARMKAGAIGEDRRAFKAISVPVVAQVAIGRRDRLNICKQRLQHA